MKSLAERRTSTDKIHEAPVRVLRGALASPTRVRTSLGRAKCPKLSILSKSHGSATRPTASISSRSKLRGDVVCESTFKFMGRLVDRSGPRLRLVSDSWQRRRHPPMGRSERRHDARQYSPTWTAFLVTGTRGSVSIRRQRNGPMLGLLARFQGAMFGCNIRMLVRAIDSMVSLLVIGLG